MNTRNLETFVRVADYDSISAAADGMFISSPALQQQLNRLEREIGFKLFDRGPGGIEMTLAGTIFLEGTKKILADMSNLLGHCRDMAAESRCIRVGAIIGLKPDLYPCISGPFRTKYPHVIQQPVMENEEQLFIDLDNGALDVIEYFDCPKAHGSGRCYLPLIWEGRDCLMSANHPLAGRKELSLDDLRGQRLIVYRFDRIPGLKEHLEENYPDIILSEDMRLVDYYTLVRSFEDGHVGLVPPHCKDKFQPLIAVPLKMEMRWSIGLVYRSKPSLILQQFLDVAKQVFA